MSKPFEHTSPAPAMVVVMNTYRERFAALADEIEKIEPSRERSLAMTKLEESAMWLNKAISRTS